VASTSEIYGDPHVHPQVESYWGNVNPVGPRGVYDEAKRFQEAITMAYHTFHGVETRIVRIFNTYGPRMRLNDGRVLPAFIGQALRGEDLTIFGDGSQTRSFCYVDDLVEGIYRLLMSDCSDPVNIGNPDEITIKDFAEEIIKLTGTNQKVVYHPLPINDPLQRQPDISKAVLLHSDGTASIPLPVESIGNSYYIALKHRNTIETWSSDTITISYNQNNYDFTNNLSKLYSDNVNSAAKNMGDGRYALFSGDVNQDGTADAMDLQITENDSYYFIFGYNSSDCNGDGASDALDMQLIENNTALFLFKARPY
jgi:hypothetical protein